MKTRLPAAVPAPLTHRHRVQGVVAGKRVFRVQSSWIVSVPRLATALMTMMADGRP
jgi:hypothetical protein